MPKTNKCTAPTEVYSRVCGFFRPVQQWNRGKKEEFKDRLNYNVKGIKDGEKG
ncbi:anaerobic ribonucleoside-triphosphate reductase [uncultured Desulfuromusa sp.]|uniref:anaerobic ribonucleoside-triphosphate reductase n=1 Tax=uncultured Desulfuromusa sp. TaxID=219183 RepID=UPI002AA814A9|nr:anaerobic ribonucleoside-triphosphate reductase [uncultured Desulfuromusa sp.]